MKITLNWAPKVFVTKLAKKKMDMLVDICNEEVGWLGIVKREHRWEFLIEDIFILKQECNAVTTELDAGDQQELWNRLYSEGILTEAEQNDRGLYLWGHSHHYMGVSPSGQDEEQIKLFLKGKPPFLIRIIANKKQEYRTDLYMLDDGFTAEELPLLVREEEDPALREAIAAEVKEKVRPFRPEPKKEPADGDLSGGFWIGGRTGAFGSFDDEEWYFKGRTNGCTTEKITPGKKKHNQDTLSFKEFLETEAGKITRQRKR